MPTITILGAGSTVFARQLMTDILLIDGLDEGCFALVDIDAERLDLERQIAERLVERSGKRWSVRASTQRRDVLAGSDFIINSIEVAGLANVRHDFDIPMKYGVNQCIGDTIGPGGIFKALRTGLAWLDILHDAERLCPQALVLNYTNPMSILTFAALIGTTMRTVGLCHSVQGTSKQLAGYLNVPHEELEWRCAGIDHNAWFTVLRYHGQDMYPRLRELAQVPDIYERDPLQQSSWTQTGPVFQYSRANGVFGPGRATFTTSPDGKQDWMVYHAKITDDFTADGRETRAQEFTWNADGTPNFGVPVSISTKLTPPSGEKEKCEKRKNNHDDPAPRISTTTMYAPNLALPEWGVAVRD